MTPRMSPRRAGILILTSILVAGCANELKRSFTAADRFDTLDKAAPYLKAHMLDGHVYVLSDWQADSLGVLGTGRLLDANRRTVRSGSLRVPVDSVALFETNRKVRSGPGIAATILAGITAAVAGVCLTNDKACFGSCPTFYAVDADGEPVLEAEAFSASIAPALEATDVDMLYRADPENRALTLKLTNEALETHVIRSADLLAVPRPTGSRVYTDMEGAFYVGREEMAPDVCRGAEGDCAALVAHFDEQERFSAADKKDLATKEFIELRFDHPPAGDLGLVITSRQTLMTTYLVYQALAYLGDEATGWLASLATADPEKLDQASGIGRMLGQIDVMLLDSLGQWVTAGSVGETGPIAWDTKVVPVSASTGPLRIRLRLTQGLWRIDRLALVQLEPSAPAILIQPSAVRRAGQDDSAALRALQDPAKTLVTMPGDEFELVYELPEDAAEYEVFLQARGYYLEWLRQEWMAEKNLLKAARLARDPAGALRALAPAYKKQESSMEHVFWNSRYVGN